MLAKTSLIAGLALISVVSFSPASKAEEAYTIRASTMRAGPDYDFPAIRRIPRNRVIDVFGCTRDYDWCDIEYDDDRGWVSGNDIAFEYDGRRQQLLEIAPFLGLAILDFAIDDYWGRYYFDRPWYGRRHDWHDWHPHEPPPPHGQPPHAPPPDGLPPKFPPPHGLPPVEPLPHNPQPTDRFPHDHHNNVPQGPLPGIPRDHGGGPIHPTLPPGVGVPHGQGGQGGPTGGHKKFCPPGQICE